MRTMLWMNTQWARTVPLWHPFKYTDPHHPHRDCPTGAPVATTLPTTALLQEQTPLQSLAQLNSCTKCLALCRSCNIGNAVAPDCTACAQADAQ